MSILRVQKIRHTASNTDVIDIANDGTCIAKLTNRNNKNLFINGSMIVAQKGVSATASSSGYPACDRWRIGAGGLDEAVTVAQSALTSSDTPYSSGFRYATKITNGNQTNGLGATDYLSFGQRLEGQDIHSSGWDFTSTSSKITVSFWIKSSVAQTFYSRFRITEASANKEYVFAVAATTSWQKITKTISGASGLNPKSNTDMGFFWDTILGYGSDYTGSMTPDQWNTVNTAAYVPDMASSWYDTDNATFEITGVQLEVGSHSTDHELQSYAQTLALCQRYFYMHASGAFPLSNTDRCPIGHGYGYTSTDGYVIITYPVQMRTNPSLYKVVGTDYFNFAYSNNNAYPNNIAANRVSNQVAELYFYDGASWGQNDGGMLRTYNTAARVGFSAEL